MEAKTYILNLLLPSQNECLCVRWRNEDITIELRSSKPLTASSIGKFSLLSKEAERLTGDQGAFISLDEDTKTKKET